MKNYIITFDTILDDIHLYLKFSKTYLKETFPDSDFDLYYLKEDLVGIVHVVYCFVDPKTMLLKNLVTLLSGFTYRYFYLLSRMILVLTHDGLKIFYHTRKYIYIHPVMFMK